MIVVAGEALIDLLVHPDGRLDAVPGGGPFNTARTIARLDGAVRFLGRFSTDSFGERLRSSLADDDVDLTLAETTERPTTLAIAELDVRGVATYRFHTAETSAAELSSEAVRTALATRPDAFHLGTLGLALEPIASVLASGIAGVAEATLVMVDPNCRPSVIADRAAYLARLDQILARADVAKVSGDDLAYIDPGVDLRVAARRLLERGPSVVLLTDGGRDVVAITRTTTLDIPVPSVPIIDTVGAGDAFGGGFLARWVERGLGRTELADPTAVLDAVTFAIDVAGVTCRHAGADPPRRADLGPDWTIDLIRR